MAYVKNTWIDQEGQVRYTETSDSGYKVFTPNYENVTEMGTPVNADNMNHIEEGLDGVAIRKHNLTETFNINEVVLGTVNNVQNLYYSLISNNVNNALSDNTKWRLAKFGVVSRNFGEIVTSSLPILDDNSLHLADGSLLTASNYPEFVNYVAELYNIEVPDVYLYAWYNDTEGVVYTLSETPVLYDPTYYEYPDTPASLIYVVEDERIGLRFQGSPPIYFNRDASRDTYTTKHFDLFCTEADWQTSNTTFGECGKYVYDSTNNTVRLPLYNTYFTNTKDVDLLGSLTEASLPNLKGSFNHETTDGVANGVFSIGSSVSAKSSEPSGSTDHYINFNAHYYNTIYKDEATTVNTQSIKQLVYIVVGK